MNLFFADAEIKSAAGESTPNHFKNRPLKNHRGCICPCIFGVLIDLLILQPFENSECAPQTFCLRLEKFPSVQILL
jgi:hypothetical protein